MVNILRLTVAYLNATINVKPETQNRRLEPTGIAKPGETRGLTGTGPGLARQESAGRVFGRFWNRTDPFLRSKPGPLAGYLDPLLTLVECAAWCPLPSPILRCAIGPIVIVSRWKPSHFRVISGSISQPLNGYWSDRKSEHGRWNRASICTFHV